ncbi:DNA replication factor Dna2-domain-containing protein [Lipomyces tetrasporus]|uniref:DNA replication ATP-dependent helicase/nuclease n=1 Tax=Lipomyces tetrasporus TaxID=54092 RepID=A0AAD7VQ27_9ASCO|nr:DNA replication factor Dna2-domain-containing protein [Lipomyces tetrasporus]KAJ8097793.1 DNA replication factor Dna2-domain-containing protein [Lipomyces tetrasporus]
MCDLLQRAKESRNSDDNAALHSRQPPTTPGHVMSSTDRKQVAICGTPAPRGILTPISLDINGMARRAIPDARKRTLTDGDPAITPYLGRHHDVGNEESITWNISPHPSSENDQIIDSWSSPSRNHDSDPRSTLPADPATELFMRYNGQRTGTGDDLAERWSSATPSGTPLGRSLSDLRRSVSCDPEWPVTVKKRRRRRPEVAKILVGVDISTALVERSKNSNSNSTTANHPSLPTRLIQNSPISEPLQPDSQNRDHNASKYRLFNDGGVDEFGFNSDDIDFDMVDKVETAQMFGLPPVVQSVSRPFEIVQARADNEGCDSPIFVSQPTKMASDRSDTGIEAPSSENPDSESPKKVDPGNENGIDNGNDEFSDLEEFDSAELEQLMGRLENPVKIVAPKLKPLKESQTIRSEILRDTQSTQRSRFPPVECKNYRRLWVEDVADGHYMVKGHARLEKRIQGRDEQLNCSVIVILRDDWINSTVDILDYINVIGDFDSTGQCVIDNKNGILIVHPDSLVSSTIVAEYFYCARKSILAYRIKSPTDVNRSTVYGTIIHELFQECMSKSNFTIEHMDNVLEEILPRHIEKLFFLDEPLPAAREHVREKFDIIQRWAANFVSLRPQANGILEDARNPGCKTTMAVVEILDTEEHIWSPMYGLKGSIDMTVTVDITGQGKVTVPFEIKTGRNSKTIIHRAQTVLYTLILADRYDAEVLNGILYYLDLSQTLNVTAMRNEIRGLIMGRNEIARSINNPEVVLPMSKNAGMCKSCFSRKGCFVYHKAVENGDGSTSGLGSLFDEATDHINEDDKTFFKHWDRLITMEENSIAKFRQEIWLMTGLERESYGRCFASLRVDAMRRSNINEKINKYEYTFSRVELSSFPDHPSFLASQISIGDPVIVSDNFGHIALGAGFLKEVTQDTIVVSLDREFDSNQHAVKSTQSQRVLFRVDKDEFSSGMALIRNNLVQLIEKDGDKKRRKLIVGKEKPKFQPTIQPHYPPGSEGLLNSDQLMAIDKVMTACDYALIMGMPGTGKTTTVSHIIETLLVQNKTILLTSYTHTAVDNILLKVREHCTNILRLGPQSKIHPEVKKFAHLQSELPDNFDDLRRFYYGSQIVATTCLGINNLIFQKRRFDYCIVDEASQITLPICIGPLRFADKFVLVGDHYQLSPLVRNKEAKAEGLDISLFKLLSEAHPSAVATLEHQYRMCEEVMTLSNVLIYNGRLKCGTPEVAVRKLPVPRLQQGLDEIHSGGGGNCKSERCWIADLLNEQTKVVFVDTDRVPAKETKKGDRIQNDIEAGLVTQFTESLVMCGVPQDSIGIISVYRAQLKLLANRLQKYPNLEMQTVDKFQGRDKECVIISLVRANDELMVGDLLTDWRRLNVTFTRARSKLVIFGSKKTLMAVDMLAKFFELVESKGWVYSVPPDAHLLHGPRSRDGTARPAGGKPHRAAVKLGAALWSRPILRDIVNELR